MRKNNTTHFMAGILMICFVGAFLLIAGRFIYIQVTGEVNNVSLIEWAKEKRMSTYALQAERGKIIDSNGMVLAYDRPSYRLYAIIDEEHTLKKSDPKHVVDIEKTAERLAPKLNAEKDFLLEQFNNGIERGSFQVEFGKFGKELDQKVKEEIEELKLSGINFDKKPIRYYPNDVFASHIIGFARKDQVEKSNESDEEEVEEDEQSVVTEDVEDADTSDSNQVLEEKTVGITGIEKVMDDLLSGEDGYVSYQRDSFNKKLLDPDEVIKKPVNGSDIHLTIDQKIQILLEDVMTEVEETYNPERITATVMHAKTGEILAMSNRPSYNPNNPIDVKNWYNDSISTPFEPGSTVKMFTWAAAIDAGVYNGNEWYPSGKYQINPRVSVINDHNGGRGWGSITFDEGFERSSNVAASKLVWEKMGPEKFLDYLKAFDFDKKTEIDLPGEIAGEILYDWPLEKLTTSFGQGSTVTPIQQMKAATAIANGGEMLQPYVIKKLVNPDTGEVIEEHEPKIVGQPISEEAANQMIELLDTVVSGENGTGKVFKLDDYSVVGKTGTAQIPNPHGPPAYLPGKSNNLYSFLGMAPKDDPELIVYVAVSKPKLGENELGSEPVSFIFKNVMENSLHYLNVSPDKEVAEAIQTVKIPKLEGKVSLLKDQLQSEGFNITVIGDGETLKASSVIEGDQVLLNERIILVTDQPTMPNIIGWSLREVYLLSNLLNLKFEPLGNGYVITQSIKEGTALKEEDYLGVEFKSPLEKHFEDTKEPIDDENLDKLENE